MNGNYNEDDEVDLLELFDCVFIKHFKKIILVSLIFGLIGLSCSLYLNTSQDNFYNSLVVNREETLKKYSNKISTSEVELVDDYYDSYLNYEKNNEYLDESIRLNGTDLYECNLRYYVEINDIYEVLSLIDEEVYADQTIIEISNKLNLNNDYKFYDEEYFIKELINIDFENYGDKEMTNANVVTIEFYYSDEDVANEIGELLSDKIDSIIDNKYANEVIKLTSFTKVADTKDISNKLTTLTNSQTKLKEELDDTYDEFNKYQLTYLSYLERSSGIHQTKVSLVKYTLIGLLVGLVLVSGYYVVVYLYMGLLHSVSQLDNYDMKVYGLVGERKRKTFVKQNISSLDTIVKLIELDMHNRNYTKLIVGTSLINKDINNIFEKLREELEIVSVYENVLNNDKFIEECEKDIPIIYIEKLEETKLKDISRINKYNNDYNINVLGVIVINE